MLCPCSSFGNSPRRVPEFGNRVCTVDADRRRRETTIKLVKFALVGAAGVLVNNVALFLFYDVARLPLLLASPLAVETAIVHNFVLNNRWTFNKDKLSLVRFIKFNSISLVGLLITVGVMFALVTQFGLHYLVANLLGIGLATVSNFGLNLFWTWGVE